MKEHSWDRGDITLLMIPHSGTLVLCYFDTLLLYRGFCHRSPISRPPPPPLGGSNPPPPPRAQANFPLALFECDTHIDHAPLHCITRNRMAHP